MSLRIEIEREEDGRWIGEVPDLPGVFAYGDDRAGVIKRVKALSLRVLADRVERGEDIPFFGDVFAVGPLPVTLNGANKNDADTSAR